MAFSSNSGGGPMADINVTPLVDVLLVLLIIFMITAPMLTHKISIDLPQATNNPPPVNPAEPINLVISSDGSISWNGSPISDLELKAQLAILGTKPNQPELHIKAAATTSYDQLAKVMAEAKSQHVEKIGFEKW